MNRHTAWPASIIGALVLISVLLFILLHLSRTVYPVNMDMRYMAGYQTVDKNYDAIVASQNAFDSSYSVQISTNRHSEGDIEIADIRGDIHHFEHAFTMGKNRFSVEIVDKDGKVASDLMVTALISRMDTDLYDQTLEGKFANNRYEFGAFEIANEGRYKILIRANKDDKTGFFDKTVYAR